MISINESQNLNSHAKPQRIIPLQSDDEHNNKQECRQIHTDKATVNGTVVNGTIVNGIKVNGSSGVLASRDLEYLHLVRLATNEVEINRGRTVWKTKS